MPDWWRTRYTVGVLIVAALGTFIVLGLARKETTPAVSESLDPISNTKGLIPARSAAEFVDSLGVIAHLSASGYADSNGVLQKLHDTGIRHVRTNNVANVNDSRYRQGVAAARLLGEEGIKLHFTTPAPANASAEAAKAAVDKRIEYIIANGLQSITESIEPFNEYDNGRTKNDEWAKSLAVAQTHLHNKRSELAPGTKILAPALIGKNLKTTASVLGSVIDRSTFDAGNIHSYYSGKAPELPFKDADGNASFRPLQEPKNQTEDLAGRLRAYAWYVSHDKPIIVTEMGFTTDPAFANRTSEAAAGIYTPRAYLETFRSGVERTYLYELLDEPQVRSGGEQHYGLYRADGSPKPAVQSLQALTSLLADGKAAKTKPLEATLKKPDDVKSLLLQKSSGDYWLALWRGVSVYDAASDTDISLQPADVSVTIDFKQPHSVELYKNLSRAKSTAVSSKPGTSATFTVGPEVSLLKISR